MTPISTDDIKSQVTEVRVNLGQKMSTAQYETRDFYVGMTLDVLEGQDPEEVIAAGKEILSSQVGEYYTKLKTALAEARGQ